MTAPTAVGAHVFAGGFSIGVNRYFDIQAVLEQDGYGVEVFKANFPGVPVYHPASAWPVSWPSIDLVYGNPPCAPWSVAGSNGKLRGELHPGYPLSVAHLGLLGTILPKVWVQESVCPIATQGRSHVDKIRATAKELGYSTTLLFHDAAHLGLAQRRRRVFIVCHNVKLEVAPLEFPRTTIGEVLADSPMWGARDMHPEWLDIIAQTPVGGKPKKWMRSNGTPQDDMPKPFHKFLTDHIVLDPDSVSPVMLGYWPPVYFHWDRDRTITLGEKGRLCSWPDDWDWAGAPVSLISKYMIQAVMPKVGEWIAGVAAASIRRDDRVREPEYQEMVLW